MNFKRILNFSLCGGLLVGSAVAYATGDLAVTLKDGGLVTWNQFVEAFNNPSSVVATLPDDDKTKLALQAEKDTLETAKTDLGTAKENLETAKGTLKTKQDAIPDLESALATAKSTFATDSTTKVGKAVQDSLNVRKTIAGLSKDSLDYVNRLGELNNQLTQKTSASTKASGVVSSLNADIASYERQLNAIPTDQETKLVEWLDSIWKAINKINTQYQTVIYWDEDEQGSSVPTYTDKFYYLEESKKSGFGTTKVLTLSFAENPNTNSYKSVTANSFYNYMMANTPNTVYVYLGTKYAEATGTNTLTMKISGYSSTNIETKASLIEDAASVIQPLTNNDKYLTKKTVYIAGNDKTAAENEALASELQGKIIKAERDLVNAQADLAKVNGEIDDINKQIDGVHKDADGKLPEGETEEKDGVNDQIAKVKEDLATEYAKLPTLHQNIVNTIAALDRSGITKAEENLLAAQGEVDEAQEDVDTKAGLVSDAEKDVETAEKHVELAKIRVTEAENTETLKARENYKEVSLNSDLTATTQFTVPFSGEIIGNGHIITVPNDKKLFTTFSGTLDGVAVNGVLFNRNDGGKLYSLTWWNNNDADQPGRIYDNGGALKKSFNEFGAFGFETRGTYGVNFDNNTIVPLKDDTKVYSINIYDDPDAENPTHKYVQVKDGKFVGVSLPVHMANVFVESETSDVNALSIPNVIYKDSKGVYRSDNVEITDMQPFYAPFEIKAVQVSFDRAFKKGKNAVVLPFKISTDSHADLNAVCSYYNEDDDTFWFTKHDDAVKANTPLLLIVNNEFEFENFTGDDGQGVTIAQTPKTQMVYHKDDMFDPSDESQSVGVFKSVNPSAIRGPQNTNKIYGFYSSSNKFESVGETATFKPFRMAIYSHDKKGSQAPRRIAIRDEYGNVIDDTVTGVENVEAVSGLNIAGGNGEIVFTSDSNYGEVAIYSFDGKLAAIAEVLEGTTTVNLVKGIYIVNGKKVMVK